MVTTYFASWYISHGRLETMTRFRVSLVTQNGMNVIKLVAKMQFRGLRQN